ncbi:hypothetical protein SUGI_0335800 [Cryptomeria japonica]|nr:hypothetical protein SUGI_0335800 [Cryptomeria japonica]
MASTDCIHPISIHNHLLQTLPEVDLDPFFTEADEIESTETDCTPPMDSEAAKRRKRIQSIVFSEKIRRKRMRECFATLTDILPEAPKNKVARYCLIDETSKYIEQLHEQVGELKQKKEQLLAKKNSYQTNSPFTDVNVSVEVFGNEINASSFFTSEPFVALGFLRSSDIVYRQISKMPTDEKNSSLASGKGKKT